MDAKKQTMPETKYRHGCLTTWLVLVIIANALTVLSYVIFILPRAVHSARPDSPAWALFVMTILGIANLVFAVALFRWKRWGFFGLLVTTTLALIINLRIGIKPAVFVAGLCGIVILYTVLQIGGKKKGWDQLE